MAAAAASSSQAKYDVFLSFRSDTGSNFTSHLYASLCRNNIKTFIDDEEIKEEDELSPILLDAIEGSKIYIVIFSKYCAFSTRCLNELLKIIECKNARGKILIPLFHDIDRSHVRKQRGTYEKAFAKHERDNQAKVQEWRMAMYEAAICEGWDYSNTRSEPELVDAIVQDVFQKLDYITEPLVPAGLVGIERRIADAEALLCIGSNDVRMVGIWGMGGAGKTTIAKMLFRKHFFQFGGCCFLENVREEWQQHGGNYLRNKLINKILGDERDRLRQKKILMVLDDVSDSQQLDYLVGKKELYGPGSRILVTTRDKSVLRNEYNGLYEVEPLDSEEAHQLFCMQAFKDVRPDLRFIHLTDMAVSHAGGNPLALKVLGYHCYCRTVDEWQSILDQLKKIPLRDIHGVMRMSYTELDVEEQNIFLDISSILTGEKKWRVARLLEGRGFSTETVMRTLQDKSLITIEKDQTITMHHLIQETGHEIIRKESPTKPDQRSRMSHPEHIYYTLSCCMEGTAETECLSLNMSEMREFSISPTAFARMPRLRFLKFYLPDGERRFNVRIPEGIEVLPDQLRYLRWDCFPGEALPASFCTEELVELDLRHSLIERLWDGVKDLANLKVLYLSGCRSLLELPNLSNAERLEEIHLDFCTSLREVPSYVLSLQHLLALNLEGCSELQSIRSDKRCKNLRWLNLSGCSKLAEFSVTSKKLQYLSLKGTAIDDFPTSVWQAKNLSCLYLSGCLRLKKLPPLVDTSSSIRSLFLDGCCNLSELPKNINLLSALNNLSLRGSCIETLPASIKHLSELRSLDVSNCKMLRSLPELPPLLQHLNSKGCPSLDTVSSSAASQLVRNPSGSQNWKLLLEQRQELRTTLRRFHYSDVLEYNHCRKLDENARKFVMGEAIHRIKCAAYLSSLAQTYADPYHRFQLFTKDSDIENFEHPCRQLCVRPLGGDVPEWFWLQEIDSSSLVVKLNANCCSHCKLSTFAFGLFLTNADEDPHLRLGGRHRICVRHLVDSPMWSFEKLWYNDVRVGLPESRIPSCFRHRAKYQSYVTVQLPPSADLLGFAFCVISSHLPSTVVEYFPMIKCECYLDDAEGMGPYESHYYHPSELEWNMISDCAFLWYDVQTSNTILEAIKESSDTHQSTSYNRRLSFVFHSTSGIKECGVWPICASDVESLGLMLKRSRL